MHHRTMWHYHMKHHPFHPKHHPRKLDESARNEILTLGIWKLFFKFAVPSIIGMLMYAVYIFIERYLWGNGLEKRVWRPSPSSTPSHSSTPELRLSWEWVLPHSFPVPSVPMTKKLLQRYSASIQSLFSYFR